MDSIQQNRAVVNTLIQQDANIRALTLKDIDSRGRERPWRLHKLNNEKLYSIVKSAKPPIYNNSQLFNIRECANTLFFKEVENRLKLTSGFFCQIRLCPLCTWRRSLKLFSQISKIISWINNKNNVKYLFVTLTIKNCVDTELKNTLNKLNAGFKKLVGNGGKRNTTVLSENLVGYLKVIEITHNSKDNTYHPHIHCILSVQPSYFKGKNYLSKQKFSILWGECLNVDYNPSIDIRAIKDNSPKAIAEIAKYPVKLTPVLNLDNAEDVIRVMKNTMQNRRLITFGGLFKEAKQALKLVDIETDTNLVNVDEDTNEDIASSETIKYTWCAGYYFRVMEGE